MTDNEIIRALELCFSTDFGKCDICPLEKRRDEVFTCIKTKQKNAIELINRQKAEIDMMRNYIHDNNLEFDLLSYAKRKDVE